MADKGIRRIITGEDGSGHSIVVSDSNSPHVKTSPHRPGVTIHNLWRTTSMPTPIEGPADTAEVGMPLEPAANGTNFRIVEFRPEGEWLHKIKSEDAHKAFGELGAGHAHAKDAPHPFMHKTKTVDYAIVLEGEVYLVLDNSEVLMKAGDVCVQRGTSHAWSNRSDKPCRIAFVLMDGAPGK